MPINVNRELIKLVENTPGVTVEIKQKFLSRISQGKLTREENPQSHFGAYFLPFDPKSRKVFLIHHKKSGLWLSPGGHMEINEYIQKTLIREAKEELCLKIQLEEIGLPFFLTITPISNHNYSCREHFDIWYLLKTDKFSINPNPREFHQSRWLTFSQAKTVVTDKNNLQAIEMAFRLMAEPI